MSTRYKVKDNDRAHFVTITTVGWTDVFTRLNHKTTIIDSLSYCQKQKGLEIYAYVLMPSHLHMVFRAKEDLNYKTLCEILKIYI